MSLWTNSVILLLLLQTPQSQAQDSNVDNRPVVIEEKPSENIPDPLVFTKKDWNLTRAYTDVFAILSDQNSCSDFFGNPRSAITVLNSFVTLVKSQPLFREVSFQMDGKPRLIRDGETGAFYRLFDRTIVNSNGSFYQRQLQPMRKIPSDVGSFPPGSRPARALILLHELGHLIRGQDGTWLLPDDGHDGLQSKANTLRVEQVCRAQLQALK